MAKAIKKQKPNIEKTFLSTASYYSDLYDDTTVKAILIRSPISSGSIHSIHIPNMPDGYSVFTAEDLPHDTWITILDTKFPIFAKDSISYKGEPIGIIIGKDFTTLHALLEAITVSYDENQSNNSTELKGVARRTVTYGNGKVKKDTAIHEIQSSYSVTLNIEETTETNGALCYANEKKLTVYTPTLWASNLRKNLETITGYSAERIIIHKTKLPISEKNAPWKNTTIAVQCAIASILAKKSVLLCLSFEEQKLYDNFNSEITITHKSITTEKGKFLHNEVDILLDVGAYNPFAKIIVDRLAITALGVYSSPNAQINVVANTSRNPPASSLIRWLDYHCFFAIENHMKEIAETVQLNPSEIRIINLPVEKNDTPFKFDTSTYEQVLQIALDKSDFFRKYETYKLNPYTEKSKKNHFPVRGIGLATAYEANGFLGAMTDTSMQNLEVSMEKDGKVIIKVINASSTIASIWKEIASSILSVDTSDIIIDSMYYQNEVSSVPETMRSNMYITSQLLKKACLAVQKQRFHQALPISVKRAFNPVSKKSWDSTSFTGAPFYVTSWIALVAEIELKIPIYSYEVRSIWISIDAGRVMNKKKARYAIQSCVKKIISQAMENQTYSEPTISITFLESNDEPKQIRELVYSTLPSAICNALSQTVQNAIQTYPVSQEMIFNMFEGISNDFSKKLGESQHNSSDETNE